MTPLGILLAEIWQKDSTIRIEQGKFSSMVRIINHSEDICVEAEGLPLVIQRVWQLFYGKEKEKYANA